MEKGAKVRINLPGNPTHGLRAEVVRQSRLTGSVTVTIAEERGAWHKGDVVVVGPGELMPDEGLRNRQISTRPVQVSSIDGSARAATLAVCKCGNDTFYLYKATGDAHVHIQCDTCNMVYCHGEGACSEVSDGQPT